MITQKIAKYNFDAVKFSPPSADSFANPFLLKITIEPRLYGDRVLLSLPGTLIVRLRSVKRGELESMSGYERAENYFVGVDGDSVTILEAVITMEDKNRPQWSEMKLGVTLAEGGDELTVGYNGTWLRIFRGGVTLNENFPTGIPAAPKDALYIDESVEIAVGGIENLTRSTFDRVVNADISYYSPYGVNAFAGDVVNFYRDGIYHLLYLLDRHHHGNRWGGGAHYFAQLTTTDFVNWIDWGPLFELDAPWQSVGTGTMFYFGGKYYMSFGWHTSRAIPEDRLAGRDLYAYYEKHNEVAPLSYAKIFAEGKYPNGANLYESCDGIKFQPCALQFHWAENPSVYAGENGLDMFCGGGQWHAAAPFSPWKLVQKGFPPCGDTEMRNSDECPSFFELNGYKYLIMGVTGFWRTEKGSDEYFDSAALGYDVYDGLCVPMAVNCGGRLIYAGWLSGIGWGSVIVQRELLQYSDGRLGMRWLPEALPTSADMDEIGNTGTLDANRSYYFELDIIPGENGRTAIAFTDRDGIGCELSLDFKRETAQFNDARSSDFAEPLEPMFTAIKTHEQHGYAWGVMPETLPHRSKNFAIAHVDIMKSPFTLKIILHRDEKMNSTVIDAEINGERTLISNRVGSFPTVYNLRAEDSEFTAARIKTIL